MAYELVSYIKRYGTDGKLARQASANKIAIYVTFSVRRMQTFRQRESYILVFFFCFFFLFQISFVVCVSVFVYGGFFAYGHMNGGGNEKRTTFNIQRLNVVYEYYEYE